MYNSGDESWEERDARNEREERARDDDSDEDYSPPSKKERDDSPLNEKERDECKPERCYYDDDESEPYVSPWRQEQDRTNQPKPSSQSKSSEGCLLTIIIGVSSTILGAVLGTLTHL